MCCVCVCVRVCTCWLSIHSYGILTSFKLIHSSKYNRLQIKTLFALCALICSGLKSCVWPFHLLFCHKVLGNWHVPPPNDTS